MSLPLATSFTVFAVLLVVTAYLNRDRPPWERDLRGITALAVVLALVGFGIGLLDLIHG